MTAANGQNGDAIPAKIDLEVGELADSAEGENDGRMASAPQTPPKPHRTGTQLWEAGSPHSPGYTWDPPVPGVHEPDTKGEVTLVSKDAMYATLSEWLPPVKWVPRYRRCLKGEETEQDKLEMGTLGYSVSGDVIAGLTVGIMLVPQCLAFALLAGLPVHMGLYSSVLPLTVYGLFGTIRQVQLGPTAVMSLLTGQALDSMCLTGEDPVGVAMRMQGASALAVFVGLWSLLLGTLKFGAIIDFMPHSVMSAFCTAAGITITTSQLKYILGITMPRKKYWWQNISYLVSHLNEAQGTVVALGFTVQALLFGLKYWKGAGDEEKRGKHWLWRFFPTDKTRTTFKLLKLIADLSSLLACVTGLLWAYAYTQAGIHPEGKFLIGSVKTTGLSFTSFSSLLDFGGSELASDAHRRLAGSAVECGPNDGKLDLGSIMFNAAYMSIVGYLETVAVGGKFAMMARYNYIPNQELRALGVSNIVCAWCLGFPVTGSFSRTAVNAMFGATSTVASAITSLVVLLAVYILLPAIALLPYASLSPIIIVGAVGVISVKEFKTAYNLDPKEFLVMFATLVVSLYMTVKEGLATGFVLGLLVAIWGLANPKMSRLGNYKQQLRDVNVFKEAALMPAAVFVRMDARINYANCRKLKEFVQSSVKEHQAYLVRRAVPDEKIKWVIIDCCAINDVDMTGVETLEQLLDTLGKQGIRLGLTNVKWPLLNKLRRDKHFWSTFMKKDGHMSVHVDETLEVILGHDEEGAKAKEGVDEAIEGLQQKLNAQLERRQSLIRRATLRG